MEELDTLLDQFVGLEAYQNLINNTSELEILFEDRFGLVDLDITARVLNHWKKNGLLPDKQIASDISTSTEVEEDYKEVKQGRPHKFNFFELLYLYIIQDLRDIGFSLEKLMKIKESLITRIDIIELLNVITKEDIESGRKEGFDMTLTEEVLKHKEELIDNIDEIPDEIRFVSILSLLIIAVLFNKLDFRIIITKEADISIDQITESGQLKRITKNIQPHIALPLYSYLGRFLSKDKYSELYVPFKLLDEQEKLILDHVRSGKYKEIKIRFNRRNSTTLELTEELKADNAKRLEEIFVKGSYQELHLKTERGVIKYGTLKTKKQL